MESSCSLGSLMSWQLLRNLPGALGERSSKQETVKQGLSVSEWGAALFAFGRVPAGNSDGTGVVGWEWPFLPAGNKKCDCFPLPHSFENESGLIQVNLWKPMLVSGCRGEMFMDSDWLCVSENRCQGSGYGKCGPAQPWGCVCMDWGLSVWYRSTPWRAIRGPRDSSSLQIKITVVPWRTHVLICSSPSILHIRQAATVWVKS